MIILRNQFINNVLKVTSGTFLAQIIMLIGMPVITRLYSKEVIGLYALFISTIGITTAFVTLAFDNTLVLPKKNTDANALLKVTLLSTFVLSCFIFLTLQLPFNFFKEYREIALFIAVGTIFQVVVNVLSYFKVRYERYSQLSFSKVIRNFTLILTQAALFYVSGIYGLLYGFLIASIVAALFLITKDDNIKEGLFKKQNRLLLFANIKRYQAYPKYFCWSNLIFALSSGLPIVIFNEYFSLEQIAIYSIATSIIIQPASLLSSSIRPVLLSKFAKTANEKKSLLTIYNKTFYALLLLAFVISFIIYFLFPMVIIFVFGEDWIESAYLTRLLIPIFIWYFISIPSSICSKVYPFQKYIFYYNIVTLILKTMVLLLFIYLDYQFNEVVLIFSLVSVVLDLINHWIVKKMVINFEEKTYV